MSLLAPPCEAQQWREAVTADQVTVVFGVIPSDMAGRIADGINLARAQHLPR